MAQKLGSVAVGTLVKLNESGSPVEFYVAKHDYESGLNGAGRTLLVRKAIHSQQVWNSSGVNTLANSTVDTWLNGTYKGSFDSDIQSAIGTTKFYYTPGNGIENVSSLERSVFLLSRNELGCLYDAYAGHEGEPLPIYSTLQNIGVQYTRTIGLQTTNYVYYVNPGGTNTAQVCTGSRGVAPAFTLPATLTVTDDGTISTAPLPPSSLEVPIQVMQGNQITVSWTAVDGADGYILERKADTDSDWEQVYSGANLTFSETVGTWTSVQYRVKAGVSGTYGDYTTSESVPVVSASIVVISGTDGDLGTLTSDVSYTVSSSGTTALTVVETINGVERTFTAVNGANNRISVLDLPTGTGTITIQASTNPGSGDVTVTREWTYTKTAPTFSEQGGLAQLTQQGANIWPKTMAEAVRTPGIWGGNLGLALSKLAGSVLYNRTQQPKYAEVNINLATAQEGDIIRLPEDGEAVEFYVAKLDYESGLNGTGRVLLVRKDCYSYANQTFWDSGNVNAYATSDIDAWFNGDYKVLLPQEVQAAMATTKFYYTPGNGNYSVGTFERAVFALSITELGLSYPYYNVEGSELPIADQLAIAYYKGGKITQWTRSPATNDSSTAITATYDGTGGGFYCNDIYAGYRPCFTLPSTFTATYYVATDGTVHDEQEYIEAGTFEDIMGGTIPMVSIETGSYVGTGTYGASNPNTLVFSNVPTLVLISSGGESNVSFSAPWIYGMPSALAIEFTNASYTNYLTWSGKTLKYYITGTRAVGQLNDSGKTYYYVAIGLAGGAS